MIRQAPWGPIHIMSVLLAGALLTAAAEAPVLAEPRPPDDRTARVTEAVQQVGAAPAAPNRDVAIPVSASRGVTLRTPTADLEMSLPAGGRARVDGLTAVYDGSARGTSVAVQPMRHGLRALVHIDTPSAPQRFEFGLAGDVDRLVLRRDGSVVALDASGAPVAVAAAPWAVDADGTPVPTHFEVHELTLTQVVRHRAGAFSYGVTADPVWAVAVAAAAWCARGAIGGVSTTALIDIYQGRRSSWRTYVQNAIVSCLVGDLGA